MISKEEFQILSDLVQEQAPHKFYDSICIWADPNWNLYWWMSTETIRLPDGKPDPTKLPACKRLGTVDEVAALIKKQNEWKVKSETDRFNYGCIFPTWDENLWEICKLRIRNPGIAIHFLASGGQGTAKSWFAAWILARLIIQVKHKDFLCLTINEPKSQSVQQKWLYHWLPKELRNPRGRLGTNAEQKMGFNPAEGFTSNRFAYGGNAIKFSFWSADITELDGQRPWTVFSDESIPLDWTKVVGDRLMSRAEGTRLHVKKFKGLVEQKNANPDMRFPILELGNLMQGVHLITWTPAQGRTDTVDKFQTDGITMEEVECDQELLPRRDPEGKIIGGEIHPRLIYGKDPAYCTRMMYPWENPIGGNWRGQKAKAIQDRTSRTEVLWKFYGITTRSGGTPFNNFNTQVHVRPSPLWIPIRGTWYMIVDPVTSGGKAWTMIWFKVAAEHQGFIAPGDVVVCMEYPCVSDMIPGVGYPDAWCQPGGKDGKGIAGGIQHAVHGGFADKAAEIRRIEAKLGALECEVDKGRQPGPIIIPEGNRIMDSRAANTVTPNQSESKTLIEWMEELGINFIPAGRGAGAAPGNTDVKAGEQMINNLLAHDREKGVLNAEKGWIEISPIVGKGPALWLLDTCTNLIAALQNYMGGKDSMWDDFVDPLRYGISADPYHRKPAEEGAGDVGGW